MSQRGMEERPFSLFFTCSGLITLLMVPALDLMGEGGIFGGSVLLGSPNPDSISDQKFNYM